MEGMTRNKWGFCLLGFTDKGLKLGKYNGCCKSRFAVIKGAERRGVFMKILQKSTLWLFLIEDTDIYQMLLVP